MLSCISVRAPAWCRGLRKHKNEMLFFLKTISKRANSSKKPDVVQLRHNNKQTVFSWSQNTALYAKETPIMTLRSITGNLVSVFLPKGYPDSVNPDYRRYIIGQSISTLFSSAGGVLSLQCLLHAVGLGAGSIPLAAALNWVIKDGLGQIGGVLFASLVNNRFDAEPKRWRFLSSLSLECSSFIELLTPLAPYYFIPIAAVANVGKNISWLAASASRAAIHNSFSIYENLADVTAKAGSQTILFSTIGTGEILALKSYLFIYSLLIDNSLFFISFCLE